MMIKKIRKKCISIKEVYSNLRFGNYFIIYIADDKNRACTYIKRKTIMSRYNLNNKNAFSISNDKKLLYNNVDISDILSDIINNKKPSKKKK